MTNRAGLSIVIPYGGRHRLPLLDAVLGRLRRCTGVDQVIVSELGPEQLATEVAARWGADLVFTHLDGPFDKPRALNTGSALAIRPDILWYDGDLLVEPEFIERALAEFRASDLDFFFPFTAIDYLDEAQSSAVIAGTLAPSDCCSIRTLLPHQGGAPGGMGLVRGDFLRRHGGMIDGFRGWGFEDLAWIHKVAVLGRIGVTAHNDQRAWHLFHADSGSYSANANRMAARSNPHFEANHARLDQVQSLSCPAAFTQAFPPQPVAAPWPAGAHLRFVHASAATRRRAADWAARITAAFGVAPALMSVPAFRAARRPRGLHAALAFGETLSACLAIATHTPDDNWLLVPDEIDDSLGPMNVTVLARDIARVELLRQRGWSVWHRAWQENDSSAAPPVIVQPLSHLLGRSRNWRVRIALDRDVLSPTAFDRPPFWYVGCHDAQGAEVSRQDASPTELRRLFAHGGDTIVIEREVHAVQPPERWTVWTLDRNRRWLDNLSGPVEVD